MFLTLYFCRYIYFFTPHGRYMYNGPKLKVNEWIRISMVYDPVSATGDGSGNSLYVDDEMYPMSRMKLRVTLEARVRWYVVEYISISIQSPEISLLMT